MESILQSLAQLAETVSKDRDVHIGSKYVLLNALVTGEGLIETGSTSHDIDYMDDEANANEDESLFVDKEQANDSDYVPKKERKPVEAVDEQLEWLSSLGDDIKSLHATTFNAHEPTPCPHLAIQPKPYQLNALARIEHNRDSPLKAILIGDPPGLGKTLPTMMAVVKAKHEAANQLPSIIVVPSSCVRQWRSEFAKFFLPDTVQVFVLRDPNTSPLELLKYDVILTSFPFIMSQYRKLCNYVCRVAQFEENGRSRRPLERPNVSIFSEIFQKKFPYLVLDEVTAIKSSRSLTFAAIQDLRASADTCIMLSGSPVDNTWFDVYAFIQLVQGHKITKKSIMTSLFAGQTVSGKKTLPPRGINFCKLIQLLNSFVVRRPENTIDLPELQEEDRYFSLTDDEADKSNFHFDKYQKIINMKSQDGVHFPAEFSKLRPWKHLARATQHACHPDMVRILQFARDPDGQYEDDEASADVLYEAEDIEKWIAWREELTKDDNWVSSRITALVDLFNECRDIDPSCSVLIFDESVYFLDIVQIAFTQMYDPVECLRYDGRTIPEKRTAILQDFERAAGANVLLISRAAGGLGLNITTANVVILCGPWWKTEWERQAIKRAHRSGQTRKVSAFRMISSNCSMDWFKARARDKKNKHNSLIMGQITRIDGAVPKIWDWDDFAC